MWTLQKMDGPFVGIVFFSLAGSLPGRACASSAGIAGDSALTTEVLYHHPVLCVVVSLLSTYCGYSCPLSPQRTSKKKGCVGMGRL